MGVIGFGNRGHSLVRWCVMPVEDVRIVTVCDPSDERIEYAKWRFNEDKYPMPKFTKDYTDIINDPEINCVLIASGWVGHIKIACEAMRNGKYVALEVGGAYSIDDCWKLVRTYEETKMPCMIMENSCFGRLEMLAYNMHKQGLFGELVHCQGGYKHNLQKRLAENVGKPGDYRGADYLHRNCDNYPTHDLGPIANLLDINRGNRMLTLTAMASKAAGIPAYIKENMPEDPRRGIRIAQGDVTTTTIKCARGETITLILDTTLPRPYSRGIQIQGTKGLVCEDNQSIFLADEAPEECHHNWSKIWGNIREYYGRYEHPTWVEFNATGLYKDVKPEYHINVDWLVFQEFYKAMRAGENTPIDVYDTAAWMAITTLSEDSIAMGGKPVAVPDFTNGEWMYRQGPMF